MNYSFEIEQHILNIEYYGNYCLNHYNYYQKEYTNSKEVINEIVNQLPPIQADNIHNFYHLLEFIHINKNDKHPKDIVETFRKYHLKKYLIYKKNSIKLKINESNKINNIE